MTVPYDAIEANYLDGFLRPKLPNYLKFHNANYRHLPHNFESMGMALKKGDHRYKAINKIGYLSYSVFINLLLASHVVDQVTKDPKDPLRAYDLLSGFFLRIGAAIDIGKQLEKEFSKSYNDTTQELIKGPSVTSASDSLKKTLKAVDSFNNRIKHNGLPTLRYNQGGLSAPKSIPRDVASWSSQKPTEGIKNLLMVEMQRTIAAFDEFFKVLADKTPNLHQRWCIQRKKSLISIHDIAVEERYAKPQTTVSEEGIPHSGVFK